MQKFYNIQQANIFDKTFLQSILLLRNEDYVRETKEMAESIMIDDEAQKEHEEIKASLFVRRNQFLASQDI